MDLASRELAVAPFGEGVAGGDGRVITYRVLYGKDVVPTELTALLNFSLNPWKHAPSILDGGRVAKGTLHLLLFKYVL